jgi:hypothetical protein
MSTSAVAQIVSINSTTVTSVPSLEYTYPNSIPITPPPITTIFLGTLSKDKAPVELTITFSSKGKPGKGEGSLPVAIIIFFAESSFVSPLAKAAFT